MLRYILVFLLIFPALCFAHVEMTHEHKTSETAHDAPDSNGDYTYTHDGVGDSPTPGTYTKNGVSYYREHTHQLSNHHAGGWKHPGYGEPAEYYLNGKKPSVYQHPDCYGDGVTHSHEVDIFKHWHDVDHSDLDIVNFKTVEHTHPACEKPDNPPHEHPDCWGDGEEHFHLRDENGFWHGIDHSDLRMVARFTALHRHPICDDDKPPPIILPGDNIFKPTDKEGDEDEDEKQTRLTPSYDLTIPCPKLTGYSIEFNDEDQIRFVGEARPAYLYVHFDNEESTIYGVLIGYQHPKALQLEDWNTWVDIDDIGIVDYRSPHTSCRTCKGKVVDDAERLVLRVLSAGGLCPVAEYPEPAPSAPSLSKGTLATSWASLKKE